MPGGLSFRLEQLLSLKGQAPVNVALKCLNEEQLSALSPDLQDQFVKCLEIDSGHPIGCRATCTTDYTLFASFFKAVLENYHKIKLDYNKVEHDWEWTGASSDEKARNEAAPVRLCAWRNFLEYPFACALTPETSLTIENLMKGVFKEIILHPSFGGKYVSFNEMKVDENNLMWKDNIFYAEEKRNNMQLRGGCYVSADAKCVVWVNKSDKDDHLVIDVFSTLKELSVASAITKVDTNASLHPLGRLKLLLELIEQHVSFASSKDFGFLSVNPVQSGVGFSLACRSGLPQLCLSTANPGLVEICNHLALTPRVLTANGEVEIVSDQFRISEARLVKLLCVGMQKLFLADELASPVTQVQEENALDKEIKKALHGEQMWGPMTKILDWLYLGSRFNAANEKRLTAASIVQIVNVAKDCPNWFTGQGSSTLKLQYHNVAIEDKASENLLVHIDAVVELLESCRKAKKHVLIHCNCGVSRSAAFVVAYLLKYQFRNKDDTVVASFPKPTVRQALDWVRNKRSMACPNQGFVEQLMKYNKEYAYDAYAQPKSKCAIS